jgi:hypothetical protein
MMLVVSQICLDPDLNHEKAQMFHLHVGLNWLKDATWLDLPLGAALGDLRVVD